MVGGKRWVEKVELENVELTLGGGGFGSVMMGKKMVESSKW